MNRIRAFVPSFSSWKKRLAFCVAVVFSHANLFAVATTEKNFWAHRRQQIEKNRAAEPSDTLLASLPSNADPAEVLKDLPAVNTQGLNRLTAAMERDLAGHGDETLSQKVSDVASHLPAQFGTIRKISLPSGVSSPKIVVHIQDIHRNTEAQQNIGAALQSLAEQDSVQLVALEGAFQPVRVDRYRDSLSPVALKHTADYLLRENLISGPVHAGMVSPRRLPPVYGIDHPDHYEANVNAYRRSVPLAPSVKEQLQSLRRDADRQKETTFNEALRAFDEAVNSYRDNRSPLGEYLTALSRIPSVPAPDSVKTFLDALKMEQSLDFQKIERERAFLLDALVAKLDKEQMQGLLNQSLAFRLGRIRHTDFYRYLRALCRKTGFSLDQYPAMESYIRYVFLSDTIHPETLFRDMAALEEKDYALLSRTEDERALTARSRRIHLAQKLAEFTLSSEEWAEYGEDPLRIPGLPLDTFEEFFRQAEARDEAMADRLAGLMHQGGVSAAVLVTGGFHTSGMEKRLRDEGCVIVQYVPKLTRVDAGQGAAYLSVFAQEKAPLEKLFKGDALFVPDHPARGMEKGATARTVAAAEQAFHEDDPSAIASTLKKLGGSESVEGVRPASDGIDFQMTSDEGKVVDVSVQHDPQGGVRKLSVTPAKGVSLARAKVVSALSRGLAFLKERVGLRKPAGTGLGDLRDFSSGLMSTARQTIQDLLAEGKPKEEKKVDGSIVTAIDRAVQQKVLEQIQRTYPGHYLVAEETLDSEEAAVNKGNAGSEYVWVLDPIDGTAQFAAGSDFYAVSLALYRKGRPVLAMVWSPVLGMLEASEDRTGVYLNGTSFDTAQDGDTGELNAVIAGQSDFSDRLNELVKKKAVAGDFRSAGIENRAKSSVVHAADVLLGKTHLYSYVGDGYGLGLWDIAAVAYLLDKGGRPFFSRESDGRLQTALDRIEQDIKEHPQSADKKFPPYNIVSGDRKVMALLDLTVGSSPLMPGDVTSAQAKPSEDVLASLFSPDVRDTDEAWSRWLAEMTSRPTIPMAWGNTPEGQRYNNYSDTLSENHRKGMQYLVDRDWQSAYRCAETIIRTINDNPYKLSETEIERLRRLYQWSYHLSNGDPLIPSKTFDLLDKNTKNESVSLAVADLNYLIARNRDLTADEWFKQIVLWHELFMDGVLPRGGKEMLQERIAHWLVDRDTPKTVVRAGVESVVDFKRDPVNYIYEAVYDMFYGTPSQQIFEDGNHRVGSVVLNYLLMRHLRVVDFGIYSVNYGKVEKRPEIFLEPLSGKKTSYRTSVIGPWNNGLTYLVHLPRFAESIPSALATLFKDGIKNLPIRVIWGLAIPIHELSHLVFARLSGMRTGWTLGSLWSSVNIDLGRAPPWKTLVTRLAGPLGNLTVGVVAWALMGTPSFQPDLGLLGDIFIVSNVSLAVLDVGASLILRRGDAWEVLSSLARPAEVRPEERLAEAVAAAASGLLEASPSRLSNSLQEILSDVPWSQGIEGISGIRRSAALSRTPFGDLDQDVFRSALREKLGFSIPKGTSVQKVRWISTQIVLGSLRRVELAGLLEAGMEGERPFLGGVIDPESKPVEFIRGVLDKAVTIRREGQSVTAVFLTQREISSTERNQIDFMGKNMGVDIRLLVDTGIHRALPGDSRREMDLFRVDALLKQQVQSGQFSSYSVIFPKSLMGDLSSLRDLPSDSLLRRAALIIIDGALRAMPMMSLSDLDEMQAVARFIAQQA